MMVLNISMNNFYYPISLPFEIDIDRFLFDQQQTRYDPELIQWEMHDWIRKNLDAYVLWSEVFYLRPYKSYDIHCDGHELDSKCKLNYIFNGENTTMHWYEPIDSGNIISAYSKSNTRYLKLEKNNSRELFKIQLDRFNLVNVGYFHSVENANRNRYCLSIVISDIETNERLDFDQVKARLIKHEPLLSRT